MTALPRRIVLALIAMTLAATTLTLVWRPLREAERFHVPSAEEAMRAQALFAAALNGVPDASSLRHRADPLGLTAHALGDEPGVALAEAEDGCAGRGAYLVRPASGPVLAIAAPHRGFDRHTGTIARQLFEEHPVAAAAWSSAPRKPLAHCLAAGDVARLPTHFLTAFSLAFAQAYPDGTIAQLHGFDRERHAASGQSAWDMVISNGTRRPDDRLLGVAVCLRRAFPDRRLAVFPADSQTLGATENAQGRALRDAGFGHFVHLELSLALRQHLAADAEARARLFACLGTRL